MSCHLAHRPHHTRVSRVRKITVQSHMTWKFSFVISYSALSMLKLLLVLSVKLNWISGVQGWAGGKERWILPSPAATRGPRQVLGFQSPLLATPAPPWLVFLHCLHCSTSCLSPTSPPRRVGQALDQALDQNTSCR